MSKAREKILTMIFAFAIAVCTIFSMVQISNLGAKAEGYSGVLQDLQKDKSFQTGNYPLNENDYSLQLIQVGLTSCRIQAPNTCLLRRRICRKTLCVPARLSRLLRSDIRLCVYRANV